MKAIKAYLLDLHEEGITMVLALLAIAAALYGLIAILA